MMVDNIMYTNDYIAKYGMKIASIRKADSAGHWVEIQNKKGSSLVVYEKLKCPEDVSLDAILRDLSMKMALFLNHSDVYGVDDAYSGTYELVCTSFLDAFGKMAANDLVGLI